jgi:hypothetical protein
MSVFEDIKIGLEQAIEYEKDKTTKTSDWLIKGISSEKLEKMKEKAIKSAEKELARKEKKEIKKAMRAYRKMHRRHRKELLKLAKETREWSWGWLDEAVRMNIKHMYEYYSEGNYVWQSDDTRIPIIEQLKHVLDLYEELDGLWSKDAMDKINNSEKLKVVYAKEEALYEEIYSYIGCNLKGWWD